MMKNLIFLCALCLILVSAQAAPLHDAARSGDIKRVRQLIDKGADVNAVNALGFSPLLLAQLNDHPQTAQLLASKGAKDQLSALVRRLQFFLTEAGFDTGGIDGALGPGTRSAIRAFQSQQNLPVTGRVAENWVRVLDQQVLNTIQRDLKTLGFYAGAVDGLMGPATLDAMRAFQQQAKLKTISSIEPGWVQALQNAVKRTAKPVSDSNQIKAIQQKLAALGYEVGTPDGIAGSATSAAIRSFQNRHKLTADGKINQQWLPVLERELLRAIQQKLSAQGFSTGSADGKMGSVTERAIRSFQQQRKLTVTGQPSAELLLTLQQQPKLEPIAKTQTPKTQQPSSKQISAIQRRLHALGYDIGKIDGVAGALTTKAAKAFQTKQGSRADGQLNDQLLASLDAALLEQANAAAKLKAKQNTATDKPKSKTEQKPATVANESKSKDEQKPITVAKARTQVSTDATIVRDIKPSPELIKEIQSRLNSLGYNAGSADGKAGKKTTQAIRAFQNRVGLKINGKVSQTLLNTIKNTPRKLARAPARPKSSGRNTEVRGKLVLQRNSKGTLLGCSIKGVQLDPAWCQPFTQRKNTGNCKAILRANSSVLLVKCG